MTHTIQSPPTSSPSSWSPAESGLAASVRDLRKSYGDKEVLSGIDLDVRRGTIVALIGRSGSGKSTILQVLAGLSNDHSGEVHVTGDPAVAFQEPRLFPWRRVIDNVAAGLTREKVPQAEARQRAAELLREVDLPDSEDAWPETLSGGQAQRVSLARALISDPALLLLDEPFGALDALTRLTAQQLLLEITRDRHPGVLLVTHDVQEAVTLADQVILLDQGTITHRLDIDLPRPRRQTHPDFAGHCAHLLRLLGITA